MDKRFEEILPQVQKPARYTGGEYGQIMKDKNDVELRMALCFPDVYEIGMSNLGLRILYQCLNDMPGVWCERAFAPWFDMAEKMREAQLPLCALESGDPLGEFDALGFSMGYEMANTTVLEMLHLAGIPLKSADRPALTPLVFAGGSACCNGEPMADFFDLMVVGEGEDADREVLELLQKAKRESWDKMTYLRAAAQIRGVYVPCLYEPVYAEDGVLLEMRPLDGAPESVTKGLMEDFEHSCYPTRQIIPSTEIVHDRVTLELFRGCIRGCRFCQAGQIYRPVRYRNVDTLIQQGREALEFTGYQEISLSSLSSSDFPGLDRLCDGLLDYCEPKGIGLSLPSLRADNFSMDIMQRVQRVRRSGLTFAPEAGTQRLRDVINKNVTEKDLLDSCAVAFQGGWNGVKLYFMLGLPTETDEDVLGIAELADRVVHCWRENAKNKSRGLRVTVSTSCFVPKPHTAFQWEPQVTREEYLRRVTLLRDNMKAKAVTYNWHDPETSYTEAVLSRGDRRLGALIEGIWRRGGYLESWSEGFSLQRWEEAAAECGLDLDFYATRRRGEDECLPWDRLNMGVTKEFLLREKHQAEAGSLSPDCRHGCSGCGAAKFLKEGKCHG
ncbi:MAG: TIGR03960 family B12-binding radical SAM protein [Oscillospiraceae bacterium]|nr:TIGR03960 family B12-binding radical SAM protein [Oscillospiraceae bacterium]